MSLEFLNIKETACLFRVGTLTIRSLSSTGQFPAPIRVGRRLLWRREDLYRWADEQRSLDPPKKHRPHRPPRTRRRDACPIP